MIKDKIRSTLIQWVNDYSKERFQRLVFNLRDLLTTLVSLFYINRLLAVRTMINRYLRCAL